jgi:hypothetical protein
MAASRITNNPSWKAMGMVRPDKPIRKQPNKKMKTSLKISIGAAVICCVASLVSTASADQVVTTQHGTWTAYPGQSTTYQVAVQQPINTDGTSKFKANGKAVIPVKFAMSQGTGPFVFESIGSDVPTDNDYSYLSFAPNTPVTFNDITDLSAVYAFTEGNCHGGSLRLASPHKPR